MGTLKITPDTEITVNYTDEELEQIRIAKEASDQVARKVGDMGSTFPQPLKQLCLTYIDIPWAVALGNQPETLRTLRATLKNIDGFETKYPSQFEQYQIRTEISSIRTSIESVLKNYPEALKSNKKK